MNLMCLLGRHKWSGCTCSGCAKTRHQWRNGKDACTQCDQMIDIATLKDLQSIANDLTGHYRLVADIQAGETKNWSGGKGFAPIGNQETPFTGVLDGNGYTIHDLHINRTQDFFIGLIGKLVLGKVTNIRLVNSHVYGGNIVGSLVGWNEGFITVSRCLGELTGVKSVGGLAGHNLGTITDCQASVNVIGGYFVGGLAGRNINGAITKCHAFGKVTALKTAGGGLVGGNEGLISGSQASGEIHHGQEKIGALGGLVGVNSGGKIEKCQAFGCVETQDCIHVGGLVGSSGLGLTNECFDKNKPGTITKCQASGRVAGFAGIGCLIGENEKGSAVSTSQACGKVRHTGKINLDDVDGLKFGDLVGSNKGTITGCPTAVPYLKIVSFDIGN